MTSNSAPNTEPLAIYIHWPFCLSKCPYCDFNSHVRERVDEAAWQQALLAELKTNAEQLQGRHITSIFFGGGTPSLMPPATVDALLNAIASHWPLDKNIEITLEANPTSVEANKFVSFAKAGVNRLSLGVQSLNPEDLAFLGRQHNVEEAKQAIELAATHFLRFSFDLIYARPKQTLGAWEKELQDALRLSAGHLSLYQLTIEENTAFHHAYHVQRQFALPEEDIAAGMYELTQEIMEAHGMPAYEISNHAKRGDESRHNITYWKYDDYLGIGPGAHGRLTKNGKRYATQTIKSPERWLEQVSRSGHGLELEDALEREQQIEECVMMGLRLREGINATQFEHKIGMKLLDALPTDRIHRLESQGLLEWQPPHLRATPRGRLLLTSVTGALLG